MRAVPREPGGAESPRKDLGEGNEHLPGYDGSVSGTERIRERRCGRSGVPSLSARLSRRVSRSGRVEDRGIEGAVCIREERGEDGEALLHQVPALPVIREIDPVEEVAPFPESPRTGSGNPRYESHPATTPPF